MPLRTLHAFALNRAAASLLPVLLSAWSTAAYGAQNAAHRSTEVHLLAPSALHFAGISEPLAVTDAQPVFSWQLTASRPELHSVAQTAFRIQVIEGSGDFASGRKILWDSGVVRSVATSGLAYAGPTLMAQHAYAWRVRVWDEKGRSSGWSSVAHWTQAPEWHAQWIAAHSHEIDSSDEPMPLFHKSFRLTKPVTRALIYASGLGQDEVRING